MSVTQRLQRAFEAVSRAVVRIFSPSDDKYPETGVQPYEGEPYDERRQER